MNSIWIARDKIGILYGYEQKPIRRGVFWRNSLENNNAEMIVLPDYWFPELKWEDEPIELIIKEKEE